MKNNRHFLVLVVGLCVSVGLWLIWLLWGMNLAHSYFQPKPSKAIASVVNASPPTTREQYFAERGQTGDAFGGLNALLTAIAGALVAWAGYMQHLLLKETRETAYLQQFESLFFHLISLTTSATGQIKGQPKQGNPQYTIPGYGTVSGSAPGSIGGDALEEYAWSIQNIVKSWDAETLDKKKLNDLVLEFCKVAYGFKAPALDSYFRLYFETFMHISHSRLSDDDKDRYSRVANSQIGGGAVMLLALFGLTPNGHRFVALIERFGLLEHLGHGYSGSYKRALQIGYRPRAFLGTIERADPAHAWKEKPLLPADQFQDQYRKALDDAQFDEGGESVASGKQ
jgi:hypothetical protein